MAYLDLFEDWSDTETFESQAIIYSEDDPADSLFVILDGEVDLSYHGDSLGVERRGGLIGEMAVLDTAERGATATALTPVRAARLSRTQFKECIDRNSDFAFHAMATLANRLRAADRFIRKKTES